MIERAGDERRPLSDRARRQLEPVLAALARRAEQLEPHEARNLEALLSELSPRLGGSDALREAVAATRARIAEAESASPPGSGVWARPTAQPGGAGARLPRPQRREPLTVGLGLAGVGLAVLALAAVAVVVPLPAGPRRPPDPPPAATAPAIALRPPLRPPLVLPREPAKPSPPPSTPRGETTDSIDAVVLALGRKEPGAAGRLIRLAEGGSAAAQLHLAILYKGGLSGLPRDEAAARRWTAEAARAGEPTAMHNLAMYLIEGEGGSADPAAGARWLAKAAALGVADSQFNLALLYQRGRGVARNLREAYRWFSIAAAGGDGEARARAVELEEQLAPKERQALDAEVTAFRPGAAPVTSDVTIVEPASTVAETQQLLARRGLYVGPIDGQDSAALRAAARRYRQEPDPSS